MTENIGILFSSYGDIDDINQLEAYFKRSFAAFALSEISDEELKARISNAVWAWRGDSLKLDYTEKNFLPTEYLGNSQKQASKIQQNLRDHFGDQNITTYVGFNFAEPYIPTTLDKIQGEGVTKLYVINQGAPYSLETTQRNFHEVQDYLTKHPEWEVEVIGLRSFAQDPRFIDVLADKIQAQVTENFPGVSETEFCIFLPIHGITEESTASDSYDEETDYIFNCLSERFSSYTVKKGYQNHEKSFGKPWLKPAAECIVQEIINEGWTNVLINGQISFTIDCSETLGEEGFDFKNEILSGGAAEKVFVAPMFNDDDRFAEVMANILADVLQGEGDLVPLVPLVPLTLSSNAL